MGRTPSSSPWSGAFLRVRSPELAKLGSGECMGKITRRHMLAPLLAIGAAALIRPAAAAGRAEIDYDVHVAMQRLRALDAKTRALVGHAIAILMFPNIVKGGFIVAGQ